MPLNLTPIIKKYKGLWVGLADNQKTVVSSGKSVTEVMRKARANGHSLPILFKVPTKILPLVG